MNTADFLRRILPARGLYIIDRPARRGFMHQVCESIEEAAAYALQFDAGGASVYHACAAYREPFVMGEKNGEPIKQVRVQRNVRALKAFWMDLDVGAEDHKYPTQDAAIEGLAAFLQATNLPMPMVVSSGGGIHIYWTLDNEILPEQWKPTAEGLKALAVAHKLRADHTCTADLARVLRPIGTANRKNESAPRWVELIADSEDVSFPHFEKVVQANCKAGGITTVREAIRKVEGTTEDINQAFAVQHNFPPCSGRRVADRCAQMRIIRDTRGNIPEPLWYAGIQLLCHSTEGEELIHEWSNGYAGYSAGETNRKIEQIRSQHLGPTLCNTFVGRNPGGCDGCPFQGKISSPAQLGTVVASAPAPVVRTIVSSRVVEVTLPTPPAPFTRGENGGIFVEEEGIVHKIYEYDFYPVEIAYDEQLGYETTRFRHYLPEEGWKECVLQSSLLARPVDFEAKLRDNHIQPLIRNKVAQYADAYLRKLRTTNKMRKMFKSQGWKTDDTEFVLGPRLYRQNDVVDAGFSQGTQSFLQPFHSKGSIEVWKELTWVFNHEGFEPHAFMLLLAFACPLLKLAGRQGFTVSALGDSGAGKSTSAMLMSSVYGHPHAAWVKREDTKLARMQRFGAHFSLPVYMDEATTIPNKELRDLIYEVPTGKGRDSMRRDYSLREGAEWATIFVTSTNDSLQSKLQLEKANAEAESLRLFEFRFPRVDAFGPVSKIIPGIVSENYGVAGEIYIQQIVSNRDAIKVRLAAVVEEAEREFGMAGKERFWSQAIALALYGGELARSWGLIDFDPASIKPWLRRETQRMRCTLDESMVGSVAILGEYMNAHIGERLTVTKLNADMLAVGTKPMREISQRYEKDTGLLFISRNHVKKWLDTKHFNYNDVKDDLYGRGVLLNPDSRKTLGAGTDYTGSQVSTWKIKANHPDLVTLIDAA